MTDDDRAPDTPAKGPEEVREAEVALASILNGIKTEKEAIRDAKRFLDRVTRWGLAR